MKLIDTHCHLYLPDFNGDLDEVIRRASLENVSAFFLPAIDSSETSSLLETTDKYPAQCYPMVGLHPVSVRDNYEEELRFVESWLEKRKFFGIGEIGLDYYWDLTFKDQQIDAFEKQIDLAVRTNLPIVIHSRNSLDDCISIVRTISKASGIFHCFTGTLRQAELIIECGFYLGIGGVVTYKNAGLSEVLKDVDLNYMVLETDSPYLSPVPFRGKRNESSYLKYIVQKLAEIKNVSPETVAEITTANAERIFGISI